MTAVSFWHQPFQVRRGPAAHPTPANADPLGGTSVEMELSGGEVVANPSDEAVREALGRLSSWEESVVLRDSELGELSLCGPDSGHHYVQCVYSDGGAPTTAERAKLSMRELVALSQLFLSGRPEWREGMVPVRSLGPRSSFVAKAVAVAAAILALVFLLARAA